ncbi:MAG: hypothetical protein Q9166_002051 [cf. Caloplaca sp. 2 TL-2023]
MPASTVSLSGKLWSDCPVSALTATGTTEATIKGMSTLYPKIGKLSDFIYKSKKFTSETRIIPIIGTVKLHGAYVDWVISYDDTVRVQSRNMLELTLKNDNYGQLNPNSLVNHEHPVIISGEWCGRGVQKGMAISQLPRHFVIISIRINNAWVSETEYADMHDEANGIFHMGKARTYRLDFDMEDIDGSEALIQGFVADVEKICPYGHARSVTGRGEGIVWKALDHVENPEMWFKYRGDSTAVSHEWKMTKSPATAANNREREYKFAVAVVTERRLEQGVEYLAETGVARDMTGLGKSFVTNDVLVEEEREMAERNIGQGRLKPSITSIARTWYKKKVIEGPAEEQNEMEAIIKKVKNVAV